MDNNSDHVDSNDGQRGEQWQDRVTGVHCLLNTGIVAKLADIFNSEANRN